MVTCIHSVGTVTGVRRATPPSPLKSALHPVVVSLQSALRKHTSAVSGGAIWHDSISVPSMQQGGVCLAGGFKRNPSSTLSLLTSLISHILHVHPHYFSATILQTQKGLIQVVLTDILYIYQHVTVPVLSCSSYPSCWPATKHTNINKKKCSICVTKGRLEVIIDSQSPAKFHISVRNNCNCIQWQ